MITTTTDKEMKGDNRGEPLESFTECIHRGEFGTSDFPHVEYHCKYEDKMGRCILDHCFYDTNESPKTAHRLVRTCAICNQEYAVDPRADYWPVCPTCTSMFKQAFSLPFVCCCCSASQAKPSKILGSRLCDKCIDELLFNHSCKHWELYEPVEVRDFDLPI